MRLLYTTFHAVFDLLLPQSVHVAQFNVLNAAALAPHARITHVEVPFPCFAALTYRARIVRHAVHAAKYHGHARAAALLGEAVAPFVAEELADRQAFGSFTAPYVLPVPLHPTRLRERGFNQAERIAAAMARELGIPMRVHGLSRVRTTASQTKQPDRIARRNSMHNAFRADAAQVFGRDFVLVDDVVTTGATLGAARAALLAAGAKNVLCIAAAH